MTDRIEKIKGTRVIGERAARAEIDFVNTLVRCGGMTTEEAEKVFAYYRKIKVLKDDKYVGGVITVKHGALLDYSTLRRALIEASK